jgi:hypothetical protein
MKIMLSLASEATAPAWPTVDTRWLIIVLAAGAIAILLRRDDRWTNPLAGAIAVATFLYVAFF